MLLLTGIGTFVLYKLAGTYSGQDALCLSGIVAGVLVGYWYGKSKGLSGIYAILVCSVLLSIPLVVLSLVLAHALQDYAESLAFFSIGFALLFSYMAGLCWGKHLTNKGTGRSQAAPML
jgi:ABC-type antimicrobial peptide transport system permease subunit